MKKGHFVLIVVAVFSSIVAIAIAQTTPIFTEFPIAVGSDSTLAMSAAFDGTNYLVGIQGDIVHHAMITAQLVSPTGSLIGSRISVGRTGGAPWVAFDGTNYLIVWVDDYNYPNLQVYGQFISTSGNLVGSAFPISVIALIQEGRGVSIAFGDSLYIVSWIMDNTLFGQLVDMSGNLVGGSIQISSTTVHEFGHAIDFDGNNFLVAWTDSVNDSDIYGQFISKSGVLVGSNFIIDDSPYPSHNPVSISFDGSKYIVCFPDSVDNTTQKWDIFARFVTTSGTVFPERITISADLGNQIAPLIAFDGTNYLITWGDFPPSSTLINSKGRFFNTSGVPVDTAFTIFDTLEDKFPLGAPVVFGGYQYLTITTRVLDFEFTEGDVYGAFVSPYTGIEEETGDIADFILQQNAPNPFHTTTSIRFQVSGANEELTHINLRIYDLFGRLVKTLVDERRESGSYVCIWNGKDDAGKEVSNGIYFIRFNAGVYNEARQLLLVR